MTAAGEGLTPDEIEQRQSVVPDDEEELDATEDHVPTADEIEQRQDVGWDDEEPNTDEDRT